MHLIILIYKFYLTRIILIFIYLQYHIELEALPYSFSLPEIESWSFREEEMEKFFEHAIK